MQTSLVSFCGFRFDRQQGTISLNEESIHLEHQQARILNLLIANKDQIVSRELIAAEVWQGLIVEDNTISKAITRLRKVLNDDAKSSRIIKTVPKKGYQFIASLEEVQKEVQEDFQEEIQEAIPENSRAKKKTVRWIAALCGLLVVIAITTWLNTSREQDPRISPTAPLVQITTTPKPISFREGVELNAHLHADQTRLLFVGDLNDGYALFSKNIGDANAREITAISSRRVYPKWLHATGSAFVYSDLDAALQCQIYRIDLQQPSRIDILAPCLSASPVEVFYNLTDNAIVWSDDAGSWHQDLASAVRKSLPFGNQSAKFQMPSPDGRFWASLQDHGELSTLSIYDIVNQVILLEKKLPYEISHFKWSAASDALYHLGEHPANQLYRMHLSGEQTLIASTSLGSMTRISDVQSGSSLEFVISSVDVDIHQLKQGEETRLINSPFSDYNPTLSETSNLLAFASKRTGSAQIWVKGKDGALQQVSQFERASYIYEIDWSPDEKRLLVKRNDSIHILDLASGENIELPIKSSTKTAWQWMSNQHIAYVDQASQSLFRFDITTHNTDLLKAGVGRAQFVSSKEHWYVSDIEGESLRRFNSEFTEPALISDTLNQRQWLIGGGKVYLVNPHHEQPASLVELSGDGKEQPVLAGDFNPLSLRITNQGVLVYHRISRNEATVYQLQLN